MGRLPWKLPGKKWKSEGFVIYVFFPTSSQWSYQSWKNRMIGHKFLCHDPKTLAYQSWNWHPYKLPWFDASGCNLCTTHRDCQFVASWGTGRLEGEVMQIIVSFPIIIHHLDTTSIPTPVWHELAPPKRGQLIKDGSFELFFVLL